jgi:hypothetical protein
VSYLKDRPDQVKSCAENLRSRADDSHGEAIKFSLGLLKILTENFYAHFVPLAYEYVLKLMRQSSFDLVRTEAFEVVLQCISLYPVETTTSCEDIMQLLVRHCKASPETVTELELSLLMQMSVALHEQILAVPSPLEWTEIAQIAFSRLVREEGLLERFHEVLLLQRLAELLVRRPVGAATFTKYFLSNVHTHNLWGVQVETLFSRVVLADSKACCKSYSVSDIFAALVVFFDEEVSVRQAVSLLKMMLATLAASPEAVGTLMIAEVNTRQELRQMFLHLAATLKQNLGQLIDAWALKTDVQSFGKLFKAVMREDVSAVYSGLLIGHLKAFLKQKAKSEDRLPYAILAADMVPTAVERLTATTDIEYLKIVHFLVVYSQNLSPLKASEVTLLYLKIIKVLSTLKAEFSRSLLKALKLSAGIVLALTKPARTKECISLSQALSVGPT